MAYLWSATRTTNLSNDSSTYARFVTNLWGVRIELLEEGVANRASVVDWLTIHGNIWRRLIDLWPQRKYGIFDTDCLTWDGRKFLPE